jgi:hypothetical protein
MTAVASKQWSLVWLVGRSPACDSSEAGSSDVSTARITYLSPTSPACPRQESNLELDLPAPDHLLKVTSHQVFVVHTWSAPTVWNPLL